MIFYFDFTNYFRLLRLAVREAPATRRRLLYRLLFRVPLVALFHAICFFLDGILFPGLRKLEVRSPVFIVGHARSGTTLLHRLMSEDRERFSSFMLYELWFPSLLQKKVIRFLGRCDRRFLGSRIAQRIKTWEDKKFGPSQDMHRMSLTAPEEDDSVLTPSCASGWWIVMLPYMGDLDFYYIDQYPPARRRRLMNYYKESVKRQLYLNGADKIHLSKNPAFSGRVESLIETFPDARIVVPMRHPDETIPSLLKLMKRAWQLRGWDDSRINRCLPIIVEHSFHTYKYPLEVLARHPETKQAIVDYRDLLAEPKRAVEQVYEQLGFPVTPAFAAVLESEQKRAKKHETSHTYSLDEFGLNSDAIHTELADLFKRYGWGEQTAAQPRSNPEGQS
jgi:omega-hydroxy-beta-dihydromenaquinone-9 sulfotransferase